MSNGFSKRSTVIVGSISLTVLIGAILLILTGSSLFQSSNKYQIEFDNVLNVVPNSSGVSVHGVNVGTVTKTWEENDIGVVEVGLDGDIVLKSDARAKLQLQSILGQKYIALNPGTASTPLEGRLTTDHTLGAADLGTILGETGPMIAGLDPGEIEQVLELVNEQTFKYTDGLGDKVDSLAATLNNAVANQDNIFEVIDDVDSLLATLVAQQDRLRAISADASALINDVQSFAEAQQPNILAIQNDLQTLANVLEANKATFDYLKQQTPVLLKLTRVLVNQLMNNIETGGNPIPVGLDNFGELLLDDKRYPPPTGP